MGAMFGGAWDPDADYKTIAKGRYKGGRTIISNLVIDGRGQFIGVEYGRDGTAEFFGTYPSVR
jgi:hypothetical protein